MMVPRSFCWTRVGTEAGMSVQDILRRKNHERRATGGSFLWGVGNNLIKSAEQLAKVEAEPNVLFSKIRGRAAAHDRKPAGVLLWLDYQDASGMVRPLPDGLFVTSGSTTRSGKPKTRQFALICYSETPLVESNLDTIHRAELRNLCSGNAVGDSQNTAIVLLSTPSIGVDLEYPVLFAARLTEFVRLMTPVLITRDEHDRVEAAAASDDTERWMAEVIALKHQALLRADRDAKAREGQP
jgi:hypothetical protein